jgi:hypothetical protein
MLLEKPAPIETSPLEYTDVEIPRIGATEVLMKISACGVCHSNLHMIEGDWLDMGVPAKTPIVPGHEVTGTVEECSLYFTMTCLHGACFFRPRRLKFKPKHALWLLTSGCILKNLAYLQNGTALLTLNVALFVSHGEPKTFS